jgi:hypothetical protein
VRALRNLVTQDPGRLRTAFGVALVLLIVVLFTGGLVVFGHGNRSHKEIKAAGQTAEWYLGQVHPETHTAEIVVATGGCLQYDHATYATTGVTTNVEVTLSPGPAVRKAESEGLPVACALELTPTRVVLHIPQGTSIVKGGCIPESKDSRGRTCATLESFWTGRPVPG